MRPSRPTWRTLTWRCGGSRAAVAGWCTACLHERAPAYETMLLCTLQAEEAVASAIEEFKLQVRRSVDTAVAREYAREVLLMM